MSTTVDPHSEAMQRGAGRWMPEFECRHNRLNGDPTPPCGCWRSESVPEFMQACPRCDVLVAPDVARCPHCNRKIGWKRD